MFIGADFNALKKPAELMADEREESNASGKVKAAHKRTQESQYNDNQQGEIRIEGFYAFFQLNNFCRRR
jgi:hypothetical protein